VQLRPINTPCSDKAPQQDTLLKHLVVEKKKEMGGWLFRAPEEGFAHRQVRFASRLEPPYTDTDDETYFRKRTRSASDEVDHEFLCVCGTILGVLAFIALVIIIVFFALKAHSEK
jgi:hypothetical protein